MSRATAAGFGLRTRLLASFCLVACLPALVVLGLQLHDGERRLVETVSKLAASENGAIHEAGGELAKLSLATLAATNQRLIGTSEAEIDRLSQALDRLGQAQLRTTSQRLIDLGLATNRQLAHELAGLDRAALATLAEDFQRLDANANRTLASTSADQAERLLHEHSRRLIAFQQELGRELEGDLATASQETARQASHELKEELRREPLVNFRLLAQIMAQGFGGTHATEARGAHVTLVNRSGHVVASTRYRRGASLRHLAIVQRALADPPELAATRPLVSYDEGAERFIGVYDRRPTGGAVVVCYNLALADADVRAVDQVVDRSLASLVATTSQGTARAIANGAPRIQAQAEHLADDTRRTLRETSERIHRQAAAAIGAHARTVARTAEGRMAAQADALSRTAALAMHREAQATLEHAVGAVAALGRQSGARARQDMGQRAGAATAAMARQLQPRIEQVGTRAEAQIPLQVQDAIAGSRRQALWEALAILALALSCGLGVSYWLSSRIADPIELEKRLKQAELDRYGQEMEIAARIQTALLPHALAVEGYDLALEMLAATEVGGDLVEFHPRPDGTFWLAVGDVTGHGLTPGLVMMMAQSMLTGFIMEQPAASPRALLGRLNRALHQNVRYRLGADHYMTLQLVRHQGFGRFVAAGLHCDMLIHRAASGRVERVRTEGCWIGLVPEVEDLLAEVAFELAPGDTLVMYTDGLIEAADARHEQYDVRRLERLVADGAGLGAAALKARILADVRAWMSAQGDDISVVVLQRAAHVSPARSAGLVREVIDV